MNAVVDFVTGIYLENSTHFIKGPKGENIDKRTLTRYGLIVYGLSFISFLTIIICYMTLAAFETESVIIVPKLPKPVPGQNCSILSAVSGELPELNSPLSVSETQMLGNCIMDPTLTGTTFANDVPDGGCPNESQYSGGSSITNTLASTTGCNLAQVTTKNLDLFKELRDMFRSFKCASMWETHWEKPGFLIPKNMGDAFLQLSKIKAKSLYFSSKEECLSTLKLDSIDIFRFGISKKIISGKSDGTAQYDPTCVYNNINAALLDFQFTPPPPSLSGLAPAVGQGTYESCLNNNELGCNILTSIVATPQLDTIGNAVINEYVISLEESTPVCPNYDSGTMVAIYNKLYPTWVADVCDAFDNLPPYQCTETKNPSFISALGSSLAIVQTILFLLVTASIALLQKGYGNAIDPAAATKEAENDTKEVEMQENKLSAGPVANVANPMLSI